MDTNPDLGIDQYKDIEWKMEFEIFSRHRTNDQLCPILTFGLHTLDHNAYNDKKSINSENMNGEIDSLILFRSDYGNLVNMREKLEDALNELNSPHCRRIQRYI